MRLSDSELLIMREIWQLGQPVTAGELVTAFSHTRGWKIQTVSTFLSRLVEKGMLSCQKVSGQNRFSPKVSEETYRAQETQEFLRTVHGGSVKNLVAALYASHGLGPEEIAELKQCLKER